MVHLECPREAIRSHEIPMEPLLEHQKQTKMANPLFSAML